MLVNYAYVALFLIVALFFTLTMLLIPVILRLININPRNPTAVKTSTYECGMETVGKTWVQFNFRYYFYALIFVALDVLVVFLYPWAVELRNLGVLAFLAVLIFVAIIVVGYIYAWKKRVLEWK